MHPQPSQIDGPPPPELSLRVGTILDDVEAEAARLRDEARAEAERVVAAARREADELIAARRRRIAEISEELVTRSEALVARLGDAEPVREGFDNLVRALGDASERLAGEMGSETADPPPARFARSAPGG